MLAILEMHFRLDYYNAIGWFLIKTLKLEALRPHPVDIIKLSKYV